jgi:hypothetical protein
MRKEKKIMERMFENFGIEVFYDKYDNEPYIREYNIDSDESNIRYIDIFDKEEVMEVLKISPSVYENSYNESQSQLIEEKAKKKEEKAKEREENILKKMIDMTFSRLDAFELLKSIPESGVKIISSDIKYIWKNDLSEIDNLKHIVNSYYNNFSTIEEVKSLKEYWNDLNKDALVKEKSFLKENYDNYHTECLKILELKKSNIKEVNPDSFKEGFEKKLTPSEAVKKHLEKKVEIAPSTLRV